jgi:DNA-binding transcriptional regulator YhcF (GntR family)
MKVNQMSDNSIITLFEALMDDEIEKNIIRLIAQGLNEEEIIEELLEIKTGRSLK